jgi:hypothetical protein
MGPPPASPPEVGLHNCFPSGNNCFGRVQDETGVAAAAWDFEGGIFQLLSLGMVPIKKIKRWK